MGNLEPQSEMILASASPRRQQMLADLGLRFRVHPAHLSEVPLGDERPDTYVERIAGEKAQRVGALFPTSLVLAADTTVCVNNHLLGKPQHQIEAREMLRRLSGQEHQVFTGVAVRGRTFRSCVVRTVVQFKQLSEAEIHWYVSTDEPLDKAGAYAIQGKGGTFVSRIVGSYSNVVGLPLVETFELLGEEMRTPWNPR